MVIDTMPSLPAIEKKRPRIAMEDRMMIRACLAEGDGPAIIVDKYFRKYPDTSEEHRTYLTRRVSRIASEDIEIIEQLREKLSAAIAKRAPLADKTVRIVKLNDLATRVEREVVRRLDNSLQQQNGSLDDALGGNVEKLTTRSLKELVDTYRSLVGQIREESEGLPPARDGSTNIHIENFQNLTLDSEQREFVRQLAERRLELSDGNEEG